MVKVAIGLNRPHLFIDSSIRLHDLRGRNYILNHAQRLFQFLIKSYALEHDLGAKILRVGGGRSEVEISQVDTELFEELFSLSNNLNQILFPSYVDIDVGSSTLIKGIPSVSASAGKVCDICKARDDYDVSGNEFLSQIKRDDPLCEIDLMLRGVGRVLNSSATMSIWTFREKNCKPCIDNQSTMFEIDDLKVYLTRRAENHGDIAVINYKSITNYLIGYTVTKAKELVNLVPKDVNRDNVSEVIKIVKAKIRDLIGSNTADQLFDASEVLYGVDFDFNPYVTYIDPLWVTINLRGRRSEVGLDSIVESGNYAYIIRGDGDHFGAFVDLNKFKEASKEIGLQINNSSEEWTMAIEEELYKFKTFLPLFLGSQYDAITVYLGGDENYIILSSSDPVDLLEIVSRIRQEILDIGVGVIKKLTNYDNVERIRKFLLERKIMTFSSSAIITKGDFPIYHINEVLNRYMEYVKEEAIPSERDSLAVLFLTNPSIRYEDKILVLKMSYEGNDILSVIPQVVGRYGYSNLNTVLQNLYVWSSEIGQEKTEELLSLVINNILKTKISEEYEGHLLGFLDLIDSLHKGSR
ncbi:hypothetical protein GWK48_10410 [Metallosphaera tengchongensis]|uniref:Type III-B CRISPR-associated protein Cas10/Cmr2 n=1 Tax=Metallosphaera tengchongensis TaxID=1532350 RepID=A0A6N0NX29_9CREN|nr:hypothetical protein [Metallosphaera tengchongensis]QKR00745.1 hypothetical protein GWK48_10410 [Metallosphaera tengchongensis]